MGWLKYGLSASAVAVWLPVRALPYFAKRSFLQTFGFSKRKLWDWSGFIGVFAKIGHILLSMTVLPLIWLSLFVVSSAAYSFECSYRLCRGQASKVRMYAKETFGWHDLELSGLFGEMIDPFAIDCDDPDIKAFWALVAKGDITAVRSFFNEKDIDFLNVKNAQGQRLLDVLLERIAATLPALQEGDKSSYRLVLAFLVGREVDAVVEHVMQFSNDNWQDVVRFSRQYLHLLQSRIKVLAPWVESSALGLTTWRCYPINPDNHRMAFDLHTMLSAHDRSDLAEKLQAQSRLSKDAPKDSQDFSEEEFMCLTNLVTSQGHRLIDCWTVHETSRKSAPKEAIERCKSQQQFVHSQIAQCLNSFLESNPAVGVSRDVQGRMLFHWIIEYWAAMEGLLGGSDNNPYEPIVLQIVNHESFDKDFWGEKGWGEAGCPLVYLPPSPSLPNTITGHLKFADPKASVRLIEDGPLASHAFAHGHASRKPFVGGPSASSVQVAVLKA